MSETTNLGGWTRGDTGAAYRRDEKGRVDGGEEEARTMADATLVELCATEVLPTELKAGA